MKQTFKLYDGKYELIYDEDAARNRYIVNGTPVRGVTGLLNDILNKPALMRWPMNEMAKLCFGMKWDDDNKRALYDPAKALLKPDTLTQEQLQDALEAGLKAHTKKSDKGKDAGTLIHEAIEIFLGEEGLPTVHADAQKAFKAFVGWFNQHRVNVLETEKIVYSPSYEFAGRFDFLAELDGKRVLADIKTTEPSPTGIRIDGTWTGIYPEMFLQLGAYAHAYREEHDFAEFPQLEDLMVVNVSKAGKLITLTASQMGLSVQDCEDAFKHGVELHNFLAKVKKTKPGQPLPEEEL